MSAIAQDTTVYETRADAIAALGTFKLASAALKASGASVADGSTLLLPLDEVCV